MKLTKKQRKTIKSIKHKLLSQVKEKEIMETEYNQEIWKCFLDFSEKSYALIRENKKEYLSQSIDLLKAINSYRSYPTVEIMLRECKELEPQKEFIKLLWEHFSLMTAEHLSDLCIQMIHEVSQYSQDHKL